MEKRIGFNLAGLQAERARSHRALALARVLQLPGERTEAPSRRCSARQPLVAAPEEQKAGRTHTSRKTLGATGAFQAEAGFSSSRAMVCTRALTAATLRSMAAFSSSVNGNSMIFSTPSPPRMTGTPT